MLTVVLLLVVGSIVAESKPLEGIETPLLGGNLYAWVFTGEGLPQRVIGEGALLKEALLKPRGVGSKLQAADSPVPKKGHVVYDQDPAFAEADAMFGPIARTTLGGITGTNTMTGAGPLQRPGLGGGVSGVFGPVRGSGIGVPATGGVGVVSALPVNNVMPSAPVLGLVGVDGGQIMRPVGGVGPLVGGSSPIGILRGLDGGMSGVAGPVRVSGVDVPATGGVVSALPISNGVSPTVGLVGVGQGQTLQPGAAPAPLVGGLPVTGSLFRGLGNGIQMGETGMTGNNIGGAGNPVQARELIYYPSDPSYLYPNTFNYGNSMYTLIPYNYGGIGYPYGSYISGSQNQAVA